MKIKNLIIVMISIVLLCSCSSETISEPPYGTSLYFKEISREEYGIIVYDTRTGVEYWVSNYAYNRGNLTLLVDTDGNPLIYTEGE
jgi:hypothetical protein